MIAIEDFLPNKHIIDAISSPKSRTIMVIGGVDSGKTTLVETIARHLCRSYDLGIIDLDVGQSHIGPPTTVSWGRTGKTFEGWEHIRQEEIYFTGTLSPEGNLLPCLTGAKFITDRATSSCGKVIIDTSGFISSAPAIALKINKVDLLSPDIVIGLEKKRELDDILSPFTFHASPSTFRVPVPRQIRLKSPEMRSQYRLKKFIAHFQEAHIREVSLQNYGIRFTRYPADLDPWSLVKRIVSFRDKRNRDLDIGIIEKFTSEGNVLSVRTPLTKVEEAVTLMIGKAIAPI